MGFIRHASTCMCHASVQCTVYSVCMCVFFPHCHSIKMKCKIKIHTAFDENSRSDSYLHCHSCLWGEYSIEYWTSNLEIDPGPKLGGTSLLHPASGPHPSAVWNPWQGFSHNFSRPSWLLAEADFQGFEVKTHIDFWTSSWKVKAASCGQSHWPACQVFSSLCVM